jgi:hypothetical protein
MIHTVPGEKLSYQTESIMFLRAKSFASLIATAKLRNSSLAQVSIRWKCRFTIDSV